MIRAAPRPLPAQGGSAGLLLDTPEVTGRRGRRPLRDRMYVLHPSQRQAKRLRAVLVPPDYSTIVPRYARCQISAGSGSDWQELHPRSAPFSFFRLARRCLSFRQDEKKDRGRIAQVPECEQAGTLRAASPAAKNTESSPGRGGLFCFDEKRYFVRIAKSLSKSLLRFERRKN